jgi:chitodextrinase
MEAVYTAYWTNGTMPDTNDLICEVDSMEELFPRASNAAPAAPILRPRSFEF